MGLWTSLVWLCELYTILHLCSVSNMRLSHARCQFFEFSTQHSPCTNVHVLFFMKPLLLHTVTPHFYILTTSLQHLGHKVFTPSCHMLTMTGILTVICMYMYFVIWTSLALTVALIKCTDLTFCSFVCCMHEGDLPRNITLSTVYYQSIHLLPFTSLFQSYCQ